VVRRCVCCLECRRQEFDLLSLDERYSVGNSAAQRIPLGHGQVFVAGVAEFSEKRLQAAPKAFGGDGIDVIEIGQRPLEC
jgi:hypothetical protein